MTQRTTKIRIPIAVDEQGNCFVHGWAQGKTDARGLKEDYADMEEQTRDMHDTAFQECHPQTVITAWATITVPLPTDQVEISEEFTAE
jgi:hypothetical protein